MSEQNLPGVEKPKTDHLGELKALEEAFLAKAAEIAHLAEGDVKRWTAIATTHIEQGTMALTRAIFKAGKGAGY